MKGYLLLLKDLLESYKTGSIDIWLQYPKMCIFDKLDDIVNQYNHTYQSTIKMKPVDVTSATHINFGVKNKWKRI